MRKYVLIITLFSAINAFGWENNLTHPTITEYAAKQFFDSDLLETDFESGGETHKASIWLQEGAKHEDDGTKAQFLLGTARSLNHFHNPTITNPTKNTIDTAGLSDLPFFISNGQSAVLWAQNGLFQVSKGWEDWSWKAVRNHQYNYLTALSKTEEDANLARMLKGLGYQMHLLQDMSQPDHVRNNTHMIDGAGLSGLESWVAEKDQSIVRQEILDNKDSDGNFVYPVPEVTIDLTKEFDETRAFENVYRLAPVTRLFDTRTYLGTSVPTTSLSQGLSEYTNGNFFSHGTIFSAERFSDDHSNKYYFPYPRKAATNLQDYINNLISPSRVNEEDGATPDSLWIRKTGDGEQVDYLAREGNFSKFWLRVRGEGKRFYGSFKLDEACYLDYAKKLIPRSVGYSKALLDYFFRGDLTVSVPTDIPPTSNRIRLNVRNSTSTVEAMDGGSIDLMITFRKYKKETDAASGKLIPDGDYQFRKYTLAGCPDTNLRCKTINTTDTLLDFDLSQNPLPPLARDISLIVVYRGKLGNELESVAFEQIYIDSVTGDLDLSLPARGVYTSVSGDSISSSYNDFGISAKNTSGTITAGTGNTELLVIYRKIAQTSPNQDPFQSKPVIATDEIYYSSATLPTVGIPSASKVELNYSLANALIPVTATDVYVYLIHTGNDGVVTYGYRDISEPTPVDIFNNTDYTCVNNQWYHAGDPAAITKADQINNNNGVDDDLDTYHHDLSNIYAKFSSTANPVSASASAFNILEPGPITSGTVKRLGYILSDYTFKYSLLANWVHVDAPLDTWTRNEGIASVDTGTAIKNQTDSSGNYVYPVMYSMRGVNMWGPTSAVYDNKNTLFPTTCSWSALPLP